MIWTVLGLTTDETGNFIINRNNELLREDCLV